MYVTGSNPLSTQDDVAAALAAGGLHVFALHGCTGAEYDDCLRRVVEADPDIIIDDGGDIMHMIRSEFSENPRISWAAARRRQPAFCVCVH